MTVIIIASISNAIERDYNVVQKRVGQKAGKMKSNSNKVSPETGKPKAGSPIKTANFSNLLVPRETLFKI